MRRILLASTYALVLLLLGLGIWLVQSQSKPDQTPPGVTRVRISGRGLSELHISYRSPATWTLSDLYAYHSVRGWAHDQAIERSLQRQWADSPSTVYAVFTRRRLFGLVSEIAIISMPADTRLGVNVRQVRCIMIEPWIKCL